MVFYVSHQYANDNLNVRKARQIVNKLQKNDLQNCYICPVLAFSCFNPHEISQDERNALRLDLLSICDALIVASEENDEVLMDIEFATLVGMEIRYAEY